MNDQELQDHLASLSTPELAWRYYAYEVELKKRSPLDAKHIEAEEFIGQEDAVEAVFAAAIAKQSLLLIGPTNCGKTMLRCIASRIRPTLIIGECRPGDTVKRCYDGAFDMNASNLDLLLLGDGKPTLTDANWAKSYWSPISAIDDYANDFIVEFGKGATRIQRVLKWAGAFAALQRSSVIGVGHAKKAASMVLRAEEMFSYER